MKIRSHKIDMLAVFIKNERPHPLRFKIEEKDESTTIKVDKIISVTDSRVAGVKSIIYLCQSQLRGEVRLYELKYKIENCSWELYKA